MFHDFNSELDQKVGVTLCTYIFECIPNEKFESKWPAVRLYCEFKMEKKDC